MCSFTQQVFTVTWSVLSCSQHCMKPLPHSPHQDLEVLCVSSVCPEVASQSISQSQLGSTQIEWGNQHVQHYPGSLSQPGKLCVDLGNRRTCTQYSKCAPKRHSGAREGRAGLTLAVQVALSGSMSRSTLCRTGAGQRVANRASMMKVSICPRKQMELLVKQHPDRAADPMKMQVCTPYTHNQVLPGPYLWVSVSVIKDEHQDAESCQLLSAV